MIEDENRMNAKIPRSREKKVTPESKAKESQVSRGGVGKVGHDAPEMGEGGMSFQQRWTRTHATVRRLRNTTAFPFCLFSGFYLNI